MGNLHVMVFPRFEPGKGFDMKKVKTYRPYTWEEEGGKT